MIPGEELPRSRLYELLVQVDRKLAVVESRVVNIEKQMDKRMAGMEDDLNSYESRATLFIAGILAVLVIAGVTVLFLLLSGRL